MDCQLRTELPQAGIQEKKISASFQKLFFASADRHKHLHKFFISLLAIAQAIVL
jgi:hypothetical protein